LCKDVLGQLGLGSSSGLINKHILALLSGFADIQCREYFADRTQTKFSEDLRRDAQKGRNQKYLFGIRQRANF
jgi:hypothetical protein